MFLGDTFILELGGHYHFGATLIYKLVDTVGWWIYSGYNLSRKHVIYYNNLTLGKRVADDNN